MQLRNIPQVIFDAYLNWGQDLSFSSTGDLLMTSGNMLSEQSVIRRLMTNPLDYIFAPTYGAGIPSYVGQDFSVDSFDTIQSAILNNMFLEQSVSQNPQPVIQFQTIQAGLFVQINYTVNSTQQPIVLNFGVNV